MDFGQVCYGIDLPYALKLGTSYAPTRALLSFAGDGELPFNDYLKSVQRWPPADPSVARAQQKIMAGQAVVDVLWEALRLRGDADQLRKKALGDLARKRFAARQQEADGTPLDVAELDLALKDLPAPATSLCYQSGGGGACVGPVSTASGRCKQIKRSARATADGVKAAGMQAQAARLKERREWQRRVAGQQRSREARAAEKKARARQQEELEFNREHHERLAAAERDRDREDGESGPIVEAACEAPALGAAARVRPRSPARRQKIGWSDAGSAALNERGFLAEKRPQSTPHYGTAQGASLSAAVTRQQDRTASAYVRASPERGELLAGTFPTFSRLPGGAGATVVPSIGFRAAGEAAQFGGSGEYAHTKRGEAGRLHENLTRSQEFKTTMLKKNAWYQ
jgi:hypothetical protein